MHKLVLCKHRIPMIKILATTFNTCFMQHLYIKLTIWNTRTQILKHKKSMDETSKANCCNIYTAQISNMQNVELLKIIKYSHIGFYYVGLILNNTQFQNRFKNRFTIWEKNTFKVWNPKGTFTVPPREWHLQKRFAQSLCPPDVSYLLPNSN